MLGSSKVMAGFLLEKSSLKMRLMMLSKPPRMSCEFKQFNRELGNTSVSLDGRCPTPAYCGNVFPL